ncbi:unnamed protein product (macronuclear) [Paramecium tetraurelia]|uniref:Protein kinase domain-containing protein n=1 Tax=Paramecium tetraurelia TaxID=5888 RepID=A0E1N7_PARTE|nr:uncharacterized protein GSPATT00022375001 [Paramecium tetraurelia]CAK89204.1 unnamed protein product [Paramecium tetraurelia]|eukprot:XP_001456601.1 hypothetical protein (macronuclear) [Paramecium tetraurelia strain d4-2]
MKQGNQVTNQLRDELVHLFSITDTKDPYLLSQRADTIKSEIEQRFRFRWSIILYSNDAKMEFSFVYGDEFTLELRSESYGMLAYIIPDQPQTQYEPRRDIGVKMPQNLYKGNYQEQIPVEKNNIVQRYQFINERIKFNNIQSSNKVLPFILSLIDFMLQILSHNGLYKLMDYLLNNIEVEIDLDQSEDSTNSMCFKVYNKNLQTFWMVEHKLEEVSKFAQDVFSTQMPDESSELFPWLLDLCTKNNDPHILDFFKSKPMEMKRKQSKKRSLSTFSQLLKMSCIEETRTHSRNTVTSKQKQYTQIILENQYRFCDLKTTRDFIDLLALLHYREIKKVGSGAQSQAFKALNQQEHLVAVKISQNTQENLYAALMQRQINQDVAENFVGNYLFQYQILEVEDILIIEEELAQNTLEDLIERKQHMKENFTDYEILQIIKDIVDQLYNLHIGRSHNDIKPENILIQDGKFILHDFGAIRQVPKDQDQVEINQIFGTILYMSPLKFEHYLSTNQKQQLDIHITHTIDAISNNFKHNPFKSDIYSLGLVLLQLLLHNDKINLKKQIECLFYEQRQQNLPTLIEKYEIYLYSEKFFLFDHKLKRIKPLLKLLLDEHEDTRISTIELATLFNSQICASIQTSFTQQFVPAIWKSEQGTCQLAYSLKSQIYQGSYNKEKQERDGYGIMYKAPKNDLIFKIQRHKKDKKSICDDEQDFDISQVTQLQESKQNLSAKQSLVQNQLQILYSGHWQNNLPHGKGELHLYNTVSDLNYKEINIDYGKLINKIDDHHEEHQLTINSQFYFGLLDSKTTINGLEAQFFLNISERLAEEDFIVGRFYYKFEFDTATQKYFGYQQPYDFTVIDLLDLNDTEIICLIINRFIKNLRNKITHFEIRRYVIEKQIFLKDKNNNYLYIRFDGQNQKDTQQKQQKDVQNRKLIQSQVVQTKSTTACCVKQKKKVSQNQHKDIEIQSDLLESQIVLECLNQQKQNVSELILQTTSLSSQTLEWLFADDMISQIEVLSFNNSLIKDSQLKLILMSQSVTQVRDLDLSYTQLSIQTVTALINSDNLNKLHKLRMAGCQQCQQFEDFIICDKAQKLTLLDISNNKWVDANLLKLFTPVYLPNLNQLNLNKTSLTEKDIKKFLETPLGKKVILVQSTSKLWESQIIDFKICIRTTNSLFENIRSLEKYGYMSQNDMEENTYIRDETLKRIAHSQGLQNIEYLNLKNQDITQYGMKHFLQSQFITNIISINLSNTKINGEVLKLIYSSKIQHLKILKLKNCNQIVFDDVQLFLKNYKAAYLQKFYISSRQISTKKLVTELKYLQSLNQTQIIFNKQEKLIDISSLLTSILTWVAILISKQKLQKFTLDLRDCKGINNGFDLFLKEIQSLKGEHSCTLIFKISKYDCKFIQVPPCQQKLQNSWNRITNQFSLFNDSYFIYLMKERFKRKDNFNSKMILIQLFSLLCTYYSGLIVVCLFLDFAVGLQFHLGQIWDFGIFTYDTYFSVNLLSNIFNILVVVSGLIFIVVKGSKVLDFVFSLQLWHFIICCVLSSSEFNNMWLILNTIISILTIFLGEYLCVRFDQQDTLIIDRLFKNKKKPVAEHKRNDDIIKINIQ